MNRLIQPAPPEADTTQQAVYIPPGIVFPSASIALESPVQIPNAQPRIPTTRIRMIHLTGVQPFLIRT